jgi:(p)ppGpp synthase/HD superfamily hydrolase
MDDINNWQEKFTSCQYSEKLLTQLVKLNSQVTKPVDIYNINKAIYYAKKYHGDQIRQSGELYYSHPIEVAYILAEYTAQNNKLVKYYNSDLIISSLLHDTIEDTSFTEEMMALIFNKNIARIVEGLTRIKAYGKISSEELLRLAWQEKHVDIMLIKIIDRIHNIQTIGVKSPEKIQKIILETFKSFIIISIYLEAEELEEILTNLCYQYLKKNNIITSGIYQLPSPTFQNDYNHKDILQLLET